MKEQNNGYVVIDGSLRDLPILNAWANSSSVYWIRPEFPCEELYFLVGNAEKTKWNCKVKASYRPKHDMFKVYVPQTAFEEPCETYYRVVCVDDKGGRHVQGEGKLRVCKAGIIGVNDVVRVCLAFFEQDAKWRKVTISTDESGNPAYNVEKTPTDVEIVPFDLYAYNKSSKQYFKVTGEISDDGECSLVVDNEPTEEGVGKVFVSDTDTGFYRLMEAVSDEAGANALVAGESEIG